MLKIYKVENNVNFICSTDQSEKDSEWTKKTRRQRSQEAGLVTNFLDVIKDQDT